MIKLFISQPMKDRTRDEIMAERERMAAKMRETLGEDVSVIESFFDKPDEEATYRCDALADLGKSLVLMAQADLAVFAKGWEGARGCRIEHQCAVDYRIPMLEEKE